MAPVKSVREEAQYRGIRTLVDQERRTVSTAPAQRMSADTLSRIRGLAPDDDGQQHQRSQTWPATMPSVDQRSAGRTVVGPSRPRKADWTPPSILDAEPNLSE